MEWQQITNFDNLTQNAFAVITGTVALVYPIDLILLTVNEK